jgi:hypothetical protein
MKSSNEITTEFREGARTPVDAEIRRTQDRPTRWAGGSKACVRPRR